MRYQTNVFLDRSDLANLRTGNPIVIEQANGKFSASGLQP